MMMWLVERFLLVLPVFITVVCFTVLYSYMCVLCVCTPVSTGVVFLYTGQFSALCTQKTTLHLSGFLTLCPCSARFTLCRWPVCCIGPGQSVVLGPSNLLSWAHTVCCFWPDRPLFKSQILNFH